MTVATKIVKRDDEYRVRLFIDGEYQAGADYYTDDLDDARDTARLMEKGAVHSDKETEFAKDEQTEYDEEN